MPGSSSGLEWIVDAHGCAPDALRDRVRLEALVGRLVTGLRVRPVGPLRWHRFPGTGGLTAVRILSESHLTLHTFPEFGSLCLNVFSCRPRRACDWAGLLAPLGVRPVLRVRSLRRRYGCAKVALTC